MCHLSWIPKSASFSPIFCSIEVSDAHPPKKLSTWYRISPRVSKFCVNPNESTAISVPDLTIELKAHVICGICGIHVNSCRKIMALESNQTCYKNAGVCQVLHKTTQPKLDSGVVSLKKWFRSVHPALVLFNKGLWNKNERKQKQQRTDSPFSIKGATHLMILMHINNHAKHIRTRQTNLPTSSRFPFVSWPCDPCPCYTNWDRLATSPGVVT